MKLKTLSFTRNYPNHKVMNKEIAGVVMGTRKSLDLTQAQIAEALGFTRKQYAEFELGRRRLAASELIVICDVLHLGIETFFPKTSANPTPKFEKPTIYGDYLGE